MWIVRLALRRPYTFVVMAMAIVLMGLVAIFRMPTDIFPEVDIPVISVVWQYPGMSPAEMEGRMVRPFEGFLTTTVNDIEHIESQSLNGVAVIRVYFQPGAKIEEAEAQVRYGLMLKKVGEAERAREAFAEVVRTYGRGGGPLDADEREWLAKAKSNLA